MTLGCGSPVAQPTPSPARGPTTTTIPTTLASSTTSPVPTPTPTPAPSPTPTPIVLSRYPFAVMVDNLAEARPHVGLDRADMVYEAPAEAGIPRLMPVYLRDGVEIELIGPVRSARHYFVYLANEYRAALVHVGASPQGFVALSETGLPDVDESRGSGAFARDPHRFAPHDAFVNSAGIRSELQQRGVTLAPSTAGLSFGTSRPGPQPATHVRIAYPGGDRYVVEYDYDAASKTYLRSMDGSPHQDGASGQRYAARSVIVQNVYVTPIPGDDAGRVDVQLVGNGRGTLFLDGTQVSLTWSKANIRTATQFRRADGAPFVLPGGQVWIQLVPTESEVSVS